MEASDGNAPMAPAKPPAELDSIIPQKRLQSPNSSKSGPADSAAANIPRKQSKNGWRGNKEPLKGHGRRQDKTATDQSRNRWKEAKLSRKNDDTKTEQAEQQKPIYAVDFPKEEIANEERRPKKKVALMIGYCGTGYKGLQIMPDVKTIESDIFGALVAAEAISKANADDPKKVQLVRCARTDKGVHAGGNVLSLKMIIEDKDIVQKINDHLPPQIRVWGVEQTINSFSAYQQCDSRIYEYLIPTHCFLPPHPHTFLARKLDEMAGEANDTEKYRSRQEDSASFWSETEEQYVKPVLDAMDPELRAQAIANLFADFARDDQGNPVADLQPARLEESGSGAPNDQASSSDDAGLAEAHAQDTSVHATDSTEQPTTSHSNHTPLELAIRSIKNAHRKARLAYRISPARLARVKSVFSRFVGTWRYHNYTVQKRMNDPSSKRHIKSFVVHGEPFLIGDTEWISLKVHGQSFMLNQIRKMVLMAAMIVRCGTHEARIQDSFDVPKMIIPRAPALGLLLERPIFDAYNKFGRLKSGMNRGAVDFDRFQAEMDAFKQKEIYERMWRDEAEQQVYENFFAGLDSLHSSQLLWATSMGVDAIGKKLEGAVDVDVDRVLGGDEVAEPGGEEG